jgi:hypothetical protein
MGRHRPSAALVVALTALAVAIGGTAIAAIGAIPSEGRFTACYQTSPSILDRIVVLAEPGDACPRTYAKVTWSQAGPAGPAGPPGPQGPSGTTGAGSRSTLTTLLVQRRVSLRDDETATVKCPTIGKRTRAVGGGATGIGINYPYVGATGQALGWTFELNRGPSYTLGRTYQGETTRNGIDDHKHSFTLHGVVQGGPKRPAVTVTVYVICARLG